MSRAVAGAAIFLCLAGGVTRPTAQEPATTMVLRIAGDVTTPLALSVATLRSYQRTTVTTDVDGRPVSYEGVLLGEILKRAGAPLGAELRGNSMASYVLATGRDGYQVVFSLAELDPGFTANSVIVADTIDGKPLSESQGPVRIVAPRDERAARSVRMLERIEVVRLRK